MEFPEKIKTEVRQASAYKCCLCHEGPIVHIHHIDPTLSKENGLHNFSNAAPLCVSCHDSYGHDSTRRNYIKEARNWWYDVVKAKYTGPEKSNHDEISRIHDKLDAIQERIHETKKKGDVVVVKESLGNDLEQTHVFQGIDYKKISHYIVPWALPREDIPFRVCWANMTVDSIYVKVPSDFVITDFINVNTSAIDDKNNVRIEPKNLKKGINYFGMAIAYNKIPKDIRFSDNIEVSLMNNNKTIWEGPIQCNIYRPVIQIKKQPTDLTLSDGQKGIVLPLSMKYIGFGEIKIGIEAKIGGIIVSRGDTFIYEIIRRLGEEGFLDDELDHKVKSRLNRNYELNPEYVKEIAENVQEKILKGGIPEEELEGDIIEQLKQSLINMKDGSKFIEIMYGRIHELILDLLVDTLNKHPADNVSLETSKTKVKADFKLPITEINVKIRYKDLMENDYPPLEIKVNIIDKREKEKGITVDIPIQIEGVEIDPLINVAKISERGDSIENK